jgi:gas vesicle protein
MSRISKFILGAMIGGMLGTIVALLLAPESGDELRGQIKDFQQKIVIDVSEAAKQKREDLERELSRLRGAASEAEAE